MRAALPWRHFLLALAVVSVWGSNFVVIKLALGHLPPLLFAALRFTFALVPAAFFLPRPTVRWKNVALYGVLIGVGQFGLLYVAMNGRISPGIASLVIQVQVFFTIGLSMWLAGEPVRVFQWFSLLLATAGIAIIVLHTDGTTTLLGLILVLMAALSWAGGNIAAKQGGPANMLSYVVWSSAFAIAPLLALSFAIEPWDSVWAAVRQADAARHGPPWRGRAGGIRSSVMPAWGWLLARHPAATIMPMALLVPVFGMGASALWLGESLPAWKLVATALVMTGLAVNLFWPCTRAVSRLNCGCAPQRGHPSRARAKPLIYCLRGRGADHCPTQASAARTKARQGALQIAKLAVHNACACSQPGPSHRGSGRDPGPDGASPSNRLISAPPQIRSDTFLPPWPRSATAATHRPPPVLPTLRRRRARRYSPRAGGALGLR